MIRTTRPVAGNKYFITKSEEGWSTCIVGKPTDSQCNVLSNCVGYACGAFNEELDLGYEKYHLNCNAENFIERAIASGLSVVSKPVVGSILCWEGAGSLAGHVAIVTAVIDDNCIKTAESAYGGSAFYTSTRYNTNGRWGMNSNYSTRGFIINPNYPPQPTPTPTYKYNIGDKVVINGSLYVSSDAPNPAGYVSNTVTTITRRVEAAHPYNTEGDLGWMNEEDIKPYTPDPKPEPEKPVYNVGDKVEIINYGKATSYGEQPTAKGVGYKREILNVWYEDDGIHLRPYPYQVGNEYGTTGFYKANALKRI